MIFKIMYFIKYFKPSFKWRLPYLLAICTIPTITLTHFSCVENGIKVGVTIGFFFFIPVICYARKKDIMEQWLEEEDD